VLAAFGALGATGAFLGATAPLAGASIHATNSGSGIGGDKAKAAELEQRIAAQGEQVQELVTTYNKVEGHLLVVEGQIAANDARLIDDQHAQAQASVKLREGAIAAYIAASSGNSGLATLNNSGTMSEQQVYMSVASGSLETDIATLQIDEVHTANLEGMLRTERADTAATLQQLTSSQHAAEAAISGDEATLANVNGNLLALVTQANERRAAAEERRTEEALAAAAQQRAAEEAAAADPPSAAVTAAVTPGTYANPLRSLSALRSDRIDQGVDYGGFGPIYAVGDGVVISTVCGGWPGGTFISYRLTDGPATGRVVYAAEDIYPTVQIGQSVTSSTVIGNVYEGPTGIETGWADSLGEGTTLAADDGQFYGANSTAFGFNFSQFLQSLGAPGGELQNDPPTGSLPSGWPQW